MDLFVQIVIYTFAILGGIATLLKVLQLSTTAHIWWSNFTEYISKKRNSKRLTKLATKNKITSIVNTTAFDLQKELPMGWVKKMHIKWVEKGDLKRVKNGQRIIRIQPSEKQDENVINGVYFYFHHTLFPKTFEVIPQRVLNAIALRLSHRTINNNPNSKVLLSKYEDTILEREIQNDNEILKFYDPFSELDKRGFFTGALIREIDDVAEQLRFKKERITFEEEISKTTGHMIEFCQKLPNVPDHLWYYENHNHVYKFLLARRTARMKVDTYLKRALEAYDGGVKRLYVFGGNNDIAFTDKLIRRIQTEGKYEHVETFDLERDFRTNLKGIGALFIRKETVANKT